MRDLWIHDNDLIVATHGRAFWILDDIAPLREAASEHCEFSPSVYARARLPHSARHQHRYASSARRTGRGQSARRRHRGLLFARRSELSHD